MAPVDELDVHRQGWVQRNEGVLKADGATQRRLPARSRQVLDRITGQDVGHLEPEDAVGPHANAGVLAAGRTKNATVSF